MSNMHIEDFKAKVAQFQVGDELKLEELCAEWNEEADRLEAEASEKAQERAVEALDNEVDGLKETLAYKEKEIGRLEGELKRLRSIIDKLLEEWVQ